MANPKKQNNFLRIGQLALLGTITGCSIQTKKGTSINWPAPVETRKVEIIIRNQTDTLCHLYGIDETEKRWRLTKDRKPFPGKLFVLSERFFGSPKSATLVFETECTKGKLIGVANTSFKIPFQTADFQREWTIRKEDIEWLTGNPKWVISPLN